MTVIKTCPKCYGVWRQWKLVPHAGMLYGAPLEEWEICPECKGKGKIETKDYEG
jgi:DnaJ-class molecular chaperone